MQLEEASGHRQRPKSLTLWLCMLAMATVSFNATRVAGWTVSDLLFLAATGALVVKLLTGNTRGLASADDRRGSPIIVIGTLVLLTAGTLSSFGAPSPLGSMMVMARFAWLTLIWFWLLRSLCDSRASFLGLVNGWRLTIILSSAAAVLGDLGIAFVTVNGEGRQQAFSLHPGELMNFLIGALPLFVLPALRGRAAGATPRSTATWSAASVLVVVAIFATGSMSALIAGGASFLAIAIAAVAANRHRPVRQRRSPLTVMALMALIPVCFVLLFSSDLPIVERLSEYREGNSGVNSSVEFRGRTNSEILDNVDNYLMVGIGPEPPAGAGASLAGEVRQSSAFADHNGVHNMWLKLLFESGLPALIGLWIILIAGGRLSYQLVVATRGTELHVIALGLFGGFVATNVSSMFGPTAYIRHFWLPLAFVGCLWTVCRSELRDRQMVPEPTPAPIRPLPIPARLAVG